MQARRLWLVVLALVSIACAQEAAPPTEKAPGNGQTGERRRIIGAAGTITAIKGDTITIKAMNGNDATIKVNDKTEYRNKEFKPAKLADFKVGDTIVVGGEPAGENAWNANMIMPRPEGGAMVLRGGPSGEGGGGEAMQKFLGENLGKTMIVGKVKEINGTKITVDRIDEQVQAFDVDENTSFKKGQESITLADIKPGDNVLARGALKDGTFVASQVNTGMRIMTRGGPAQPAQPPQQ